MNPNRTTEAEPRSGTTDAALLGAMRLWLATTLASEDALDCVVDAMLDDALATELDGAREWLIDSAQRLPDSMRATARCIGLLSGAASLDSYQ